MKALDLTGGTYGRLTVMRRMPNRKGQAVWLFKCECGKFKTAICAKIKSGNTQSCGCLRKTHKPNYVHGYSYKSEYHSWNNAKRRCTEKTNTNYHRYGGRGISMCPEWARSFKAFIEHIGPKASQKLQLDRIDNNGNYEPGNVRWVTASQQAFNREPKSIKYQEPS